MEEKPCPLCDTVAEHEVETANSIVYIIKCERCGDFKISLHDILGLRKELPEFSYIVSGITRWAKENEKDTPYIDYEYVENIQNEPIIPNGTFEKINKILLYVQKKSSYYGQAIDISLSNDYPIAYAKNEDEMYNILNDMVEENNLRKVVKSNMEGNNSYQLTAAGMKRIDEIEKTEPDSDQAFVATWFDEKGIMDEAYEKGFKPALIDTGYHPKWMKIEQHNNKMDEEIIKEIRKSGLLVADFTENRNNVYFETGFAQGLSIPVIFTCREDYIDKLDMHVRQYLHVKWKNPEKLKIKLISRIEETIQNKGK